jgi:hypothetical protein
MTLPKKRLTLTATPHYSSVSLSGKSEMLYFGITNSGGVGKYLLSVLFSLAKETQWHQTGTSEGMRFSPAQPEQRELL